MKNCWVAYERTDFLRFDFCIDFENLPEAKIKQNEVIVFFNDEEKNKIPENHKDIISILKELPESLISILIHELICDNLIMGVVKNNWPIDESIIINFKNRFNRNVNFENNEITLRILNDPHYCLEEMCDSRFLDKFLFIA